MKASLVYDERGVGRTPDGAWAYFLAVRPASEKALPAGHAAERSRWMSLAFVEGEEGREMLPSSDEESEWEREGEDEEMGGMGGEGGEKDGEGEEGMGGGDVLVGLEGGVAGLVLSGVSVT